jgi:hypothetical protein
MHMKLSILPFVAAAALWSSAALADCASYISDFQKTVNEDLKSGKLDDKTHDSISGEVGRIDKLCKDGDQGRALKVLTTTQERYGYRDVEGHVRPGGPPKP